jgi:hypothetical protein
MEAAFTFHKGGTFQLNKAQAPIALFDAARNWYVGVNYGGAGDGQLTFFNNSQGIVMRMGDTNLWFAGNNVTFGLFPGPYAGQTEAVGAGLLSGRIYRDLDNTLKQVQ